MTNNIRPPSPLVAKQEKESADIKARGTEALVMQESTNVPTAYVLFRGDYDKRRDKVGAGHARRASAHAGGFAA